MRGNHVEVKKVILQEVKKVILQADKNLFVHIQLSSEI